METQIKEELEDVSICDSGELASLTLIEKYDRFQMGHDPDSDGESDEDLFSNDTIREEYALMKRNTANYIRSGDHKLSSHHTRKFKSSLETDLPIDVEETSRNGNEKPDSPQSSNQNPDIISFDKLIEQLNSVKRCETDWKTISCTEEEFNRISYIHAQILKFIETKANKSFEGPSCTKDLDEHQQQPEEVDDVDDDEDDEQQNEEVEVEDNLDEDDDDDDDPDEDNYVEIKVNDNGIEDRIADQENDDERLLAEKIESVRLVRDRFYEVEQQVREYIEQLELVERYKMESVG